MNKLEMENAHQKCTSSMKVHVATYKYNICTTSFSNCHILETIAMGYYIFSLFGGDFNLMVW